MQVGLVGNPNVGKSSLFNLLTGMHQHTGNWPGKTVEKTSGFINYKNKKIIIDDLPGTYSLSSHSLEEEVTYQYIKNNKYDVLVIVTDASSLERNINLVLQILSQTGKVIICVNLIDEALKNGIIIDKEKMQQILKVPVVFTSAKKKTGINDLLNQIINFKQGKTYKINYNEYIVNAYKAKNKEKYLKSKGLNWDDIKLMKADDISHEASSIFKKIVKINQQKKLNNQYKIDKILTGKITGYLIMLLILLIIFWITIKGANIISDILYKWLFILNDKVLLILKHIFIPNIIIQILVNGILRTLFWVVSVMLPPMTIFFPLFTLLEDIGYLPRVAFNLDNAFKKCNSCGKQALTMAMGFGCNVVGVLGSRIIDSKRERLISILTNSFIPCNGRFPILLSIITMFLTFNINSSLLCSLILILFIIFTILMVFIISKVLSLTILKGEKSSFTLEMPPFRIPNISSVIIRSIFDRTLFVLKRAVYISAIAGLIIWLMANINIGNISILKWCVNHLNTFGKLFGLDGVILVAFILGFPANEIVIPIMLMGYLSLSTLTQYNNLYQLKTIFINNGWTYITAICVIVFTLMHFPCLTTVITIKKETNTKWALLSILIPLICGLSICFILSHIL